MRGLLLEHFHGIENGALKMRPFLFVSEADFSSLHDHDFVRQRFSIIVKVVVDLLCQTLHCARLQLIEEQNTGEYLLVRFLVVGFS